MIDIITRTFTPDILQFLFRGAGMTIALSVVIVLISVVFGTVLGLLRSYDRFILGRLASIYIELFRNTPNLLWIYICYIFMPLPSAFLRASSAFVLFTSAMIAEIVRGGLNAIPQGQFEAAHSQGFTFFGALWYIILPQCFKRIVPTLMSQIITVVKDTSFLSSVAVAELMFNAKRLMSMLNKLTGQTLGIVHIILILGFAFLVYFAINFTLSCVVRHLQKRNNTAAQTH